MTTIRWLRGAGLSWRVRVLVVVVTLLVGIGAVKAAPYPSQRIRWLTANHTSSPDPYWDIAVDGAAFRRAARTVRRGSTYYLYYPASRLQYSHDLLGAGLLFLTPALPVQHVRDADWIVAYGTRRETPPGVRAAETVQLAPGIRLVRVAR